MTAGQDFVDQFIDDYFSECDEHLTTVRRLLLALEQQESVPPDSAAIHELLRALHTLKGLSGMVGLSSAEEVAHAMEDGFRAVPPNHCIPGELLETLFQGEALLESAIEARRTNAPSPSPGPYVDRMRDVVRAVGSAPMDSRAVPVPVGPPSGVQIGMRLRTIEFTPSPALAGRGIGVELVRHRLMAIGEIVTTVPRVRPQGGLVFEFGVALRDGASFPDSWREDGLTWEAWDAADPSVGMIVHEAALPGPGVDARANPGYVAPTASNVVRVDLARLDDLMRMVGELVVARARLGELVAQASTTLPAAQWDALNDATEGIERQLRSIREGVTRVRLVAMSEVFERMRFAMRDIARDTQRRIHLAFEGQDTEIDKLVVDRMLEPLLHLVRNAASHGIEAPAIREAAAKPAEGTIWLRARAAGDRIVIEVEDDGAGIDRQHIARRAQSLGLAVTGDGLASEELLDVLCSPGFSTRETADMASGRGVGMAVARTTIRALGGELSVDSVVGHGTRFSIELPLTLMITDALIVEIGDQAMAIPQGALREIVQLDPAAVTHMERNDLLSYRGRVVPLVDLQAFFRLAPRASPTRHVLIVGNDNHPVGLVVDRVIGLREIVVHPVSDPMVAVPGIAGATELADGRVSLILDAAALVRGTRVPTVRATTSPHSLPTPSPQLLPQRARAESIPERLWR